MDLPRLSLMLVVCGACADADNRSRSAGDKADESAPTCEQLREFSYASCRTADCPADFELAEGEPCEPLTECGIPNPCADSEILVCSETGFWSLETVFAQSSCVADPDCPEDFTEAEGTECFESGKTCGIGDPCRRSQVLVCSETGFWGLETTFPVADCNVDWQACLADTEWGDVNELASELCVTGCVAAPWCD
jgi:hypothetical protein